MSKQYLEPFIHKIFLLQKGMGGTAKWYEFFFFMGVITKDILSESLWTSGLK